MDEMGWLRVAELLRKPLPDESEVKIRTMWYTYCPVCDALNDWSDNRVDAGRARRDHIRAHRERSSDGIR